MTLKWGDEELRYLRSGIKETKQTEDSNEWAWWGIFGALLIMEVIFIVKIISLF